MRILGFDDDNHALCFRCEDGTTFDNCRELVDFLCTPHAMRFEVKVFAIVDEWTPALETLGEDKVDEMFYFIEGYGRQPEGMTLEEVFNLFWDAAERRHW